MSKLLAALIGAGVAVGVGYVIWRVRKERDRRAKDEGAKRESDAAQASHAEASPRCPSVSAEPPANETTPTASSTAPPAPTSTAPAAGSSTPTPGLMKQLAHAPTPEPQTAPPIAPGHDRRARSRERVPGRGGIPS